MSGDGCGPLLYVYYPIPANPMAVALAILLGAVAFLLGPLAAPAGLWPLGGLCFLPFGLVLLWMLAHKPSATLVYEGGIELSLPLWRRILGEPRYIPWSDVRDVYPASYEVAGSFLSPFASSAGTLVHVGLGIETRDGRRRLVRFTPGSIRAFRAESPAFQEAIGIIRDRFARAGRPMVTTAKPLRDEEVLRLQEEARRPLVSIATVFLAFFLPPVLVATVFLAAPFLQIAYSSALLAAAVVLGLLPPAVSMVATLRRSERRNAILSELAKFQESVRGAATPPARDEASRAP